MAPLNDIKLVIPVTDDWFMAKTDDTSIVSDMGDLYDVGVEFSELLECAATASVVAAQTAMPAEAAVFESTNVPDLFPDSNDDDYVVDDPRREAEIDLAMGRVTQELSRHLSPFLREVARQLPAISDPAMLSVTAQQLGDKRVLLRLRPLEE